LPDTFTMGWIESDGLPVFPHQRRGFGKVVIEGIGNYNLKGKVNFYFAASGVTWRLACPAANALESTMKAMGQLSGRPF
jgi:5-enolpyruvylshikimate-3-phosphate synthase